MTTNPIQFSSTTLFNKTPVDANQVATLTVALAHINLLQAEPEKSETLYAKIKIGKNLLNHLMVQIFHQTYPIEELQKELANQLQTLNNIFNKPTEERKEQ